MSVHYVGECAVQLRDRRGHLLSMGLPESRRPLDVGQQQCDRSSRHKITHTRIVPVQRINLAHASQLLSGKGRETSADGRRFAAIYDVGCEYLRPLTDGLGIGAPPPWTHIVTIREQVVNPMTLPPRRVVLTAMSIRRQLKQIADALVPPEVAINDISTSTGATQVATAFAELGIADVLGDGGLTS